MSTAAIIKDLVDLLARIDRSAGELDEPLPDDTVTAIQDAVVPLGTAALPLLHERLVEEWTVPGRDPTYLIHVLGQIGSVESISYLIEHHANHSSYMSGSVAIAALRTIAADAGYEYLAMLLEHWHQGDIHAFNTEHEATIAMTALGEWGNTRAIAPLINVARESAKLRVREHAVRSLACYPEAHSLLRELGEADASMRALISSVLSSDANTETAS